jgi:hypothetical protein
MPYKPTAQVASHATAAPAPNRAERGTQPFRHGGTIRASSDGGGKGSEFVIRLPLAAASAARRASDRGTQGDVLRTARTGRRILVVDDNVDAARMMADALESDALAS